MKATLARRIAPGLALSLVCAFLLTLGRAQPTAGSPPTRDDSDAATLHGRVQNQATGRYLGRARVSVKGSNIESFTDDQGNYVLPGLRPGSVTLEVEYTGLDTHEESLELAQGAVVKKDFFLTNRERYGIQLDPGIVASHRETDAEAIAINEQRYAPNIKSVVATDAFGAVFGSSVGDFLKFLPGVSIEYDEADVMGVSVRGIGDDKTSVLVDGAPIVTGSIIGPKRAVDMRTQDLNTMTRIEITKVPTPSMPADTLGGVVNLVSKNAFDRKGRKVEIGTHLSWTDHTFSFEKEPIAYGDQKIYKMRPGFDLDYTQPIGENFGFVFTGSYQAKLIEQNITRNIYRTEAAGTAVSATAPYL